MTNEQILKKAIEKAIKNGLAHFGFKIALGIETIGTLKFTEKDWKREIESENYLKLIFSHDFAKAFWGTKWKDGDVIQTPMSEILAQEDIKPWQHHLRQMVLEEKPLKYLEKFL